jgi:hypothetical protein
MVVKIIVDKLIDDQHISKFEGDHFDQKYFHTIIDYDADVYTNDNKLLLKFRKNVINKKLTDMALSSYRSQAKVRHNNRGASAGLLDFEKLPKFVKSLHEPHKFRTGFITSTGKKSRSKIGNLSPSNIAGYFDTPARNTGDKAPCRLTSFTKKHEHLWQKSLPFLQRCDKIFRKLTPKKHYRQWIQAHITPDYTISDTAFSTITINYSWRTALHKDVGDFMSGFGNLIVIEDDQNPNKYQGCYTGFPQYGVAVDVRTGDFLAMDVHQWHCNTEFIPVDLNLSDQSDGDLSSDQLTPQYNPKNKIKEWKYNRLSVVCYLRGKMINCQTDKPDYKLLDKIYRQTHTNI